MEENGERLRRATVTKPFEYGLEKCWEGMAFGSSREPEDEKVSKMLRREWDSQAWKEIMAYLIREVPSTFVYLPIAPFRPHPPGHSSLDPLSRLLHLESRIGHVSQQFRNR